MKKGRIQPYSRALQAALGAVRTNAALGYGLAPLHPTKAMIAAGALAGGVSFAVAGTVYATMLAAQDSKGHDDAARTLIGAQENIPH